MAMDIAADQPREDHLYVFTDNQAALTNILTPTTSSGQYLVRRILSKASELQALGWNIQFHWIPALVGVPGNEEADIAAKGATGWSRHGDQSSFRAIHPEHIRTQTTAIRRVIRERLLEEWKKSWQCETRGGELRRVMPLPAKGIVQVHKGLPRYLSSILTQLRTGKVGLRDFLFSRRVPQVESPECLCGQGRQTVAHVLLSCRRHAEERERLWTDEKTSTKGRKVLDLRVLLNSPTYASGAARFVKATGLLGQFRSVEST